MLPSEPKNASYHSAVALAFFNTANILTGRDHFIRSRRRCQDNSKIILKKICVMVWTGFIWLRIGTSGGLL
jgi:hypothetical protein